MSVLEDKIKKNKDLFDVSEPSDGHLSRFKDMLNELHGEEATPRRRSILSYWRIAAVFIALMAISGSLIWLVPGHSSSTVAAAELHDDVKEVKFFYEEKENPS